jgi:hypothetical protein
VVAKTDLGAACVWPKLAHRTVRWVLLHMIEQTARHAGHAGTREALHGSRGI